MEPDVGNPTVGKPDCGVGPGKFRFYTNRLIDTGTGFDQRISWYRPDLKQFGNRQRKEAYLYGRPLFSFGYSLGERHAVKRAPATKRRRREMEIYLNGEREQVNPGETVRELLSRKGLGNARVVLVYNAGFAGGGMGRAPGRKSGNRSPELCGRR